MILVPKKVIESEIRLTNEEIDILVEYRIMMDRFINFMERDDISEVAGFHKEFFIHCKECAEQICTKALIERDRGGAPDLWGIFNDKTIKNG